MILEYENIVIGSDVRALMFAFCNQYPIFYTEPRCPHFFEFLDLSFDLEFLRIDNSPRIYKSFKNDYEFGEHQLKLWEKLSFLLSFEGLAPLSNLCHSMRYNGDSLVCAGEYSKLCEIKFDKCYYFGDNRTYKLVNEKEKPNARFKTYDRIAFTSGGKHDIDYGETGDDFVRQVWFYSSDRICGNTGVKDACVLSILTDEQLRDHPYTETMANFKLVDYMQTSGLYGNVYRYNKNGKALHRNFKTHKISREKYLIDEPEWDETHRIKKIDDSLGVLTEMAAEADLTRYMYLNEPSL
jgi:hypothetical protein